MIRTHLMLFACFIFFACQTIKETEPSTTPTILTTQTSFSNELGSEKANLLEGQESYSCVAQAKMEESEALSLSELSSLPKEAVTTLAVFLEGNSLHWRVVETPNTPTPLLEVLAKDTHPFVRFRVARNPNAD